MAGLKSNSQVAAKIVINAIKTKEREFSLFKTCMDIKSLITWDFNFEDFKDAVYEVPDIEIEILWYLHILQILPFEISLTRFRSETALDEFRQNIYNFFLRDCDEDEALEFVQLGLITYVLSKAFSGTGGETEKVCSTIMQDFLRESFSLRKDNGMEKRTTFFLKIWKCGLVEFEMLHKFCIYSLHQFLENQNATMMEAFEIQEYCKSHDEPFHMILLIEKIVKCLTPEEVVCILFETNLGRAINWKNYVVILEAFIRTQDNKAEIILRNNEGLIKRAFQHLNQSALKQAIINGRQAALQSKEIFPTAYKHWFSNQLGDSLYIKVPQNLSFFIQVLADLVPYEKNVGVLKVFLEKPLNVPNEYQSIYNDYRVLLKTRIKDLEPQVQPKDVISKLLVLYQDSGKIPAYIMEASLMQKQYYLTVFLPALLSPRVVPNFPDVRERFIEEMHKIGKIPGLMFQKYKAACDQKKQELFAGEVVF